jgi:mannose-6-phosphate isomerase-like protein (cupin superfamily)
VGNEGDVALRKTSIYGLPDSERNLLDSILPVGKVIYGGLHICKPGETAHEDEERHIHEGHYEIFVNVQGRGVVEVEGVDHEFRLGDVVLIEPGESHHVRSDSGDPLVNFYFGARMRDENG